MLYMRASRKMAYSSPSSHRGDGSPSARQRDLLSQAYGCTAISRRPRPSCPFLCAVPPPALCALARSDSPSCPFPQLLFERAFQASIRYKLSVGSMWTNTTVVYAHTMVLVAGISTESLCTSDTHFVRAQECRSSLVCLKRPQGRYRIDCDPCCTIAIALSLLSRVCGIFLLAPVSTVGSVCSRNNDTRSLWEVKPVFEGVSRCQNYR